MRKKILFLIVGLCLTATLSAMMWPDNFTEKLKEKLKTFQQYLPMEQVYVQMDKMHYRAGETIWLAGYVRSLADLSKAGPSEILQIELLDAAGKALEKRGFQLSEGKAEGTIELPNELPTGTYQLRAYTHWQLNEREPAIFHQPVFVKGISGPGSKTDILSDKGYQLDFMPEGGSLIYGLKSRVAFKMVDEKGLPVEVAGTIKDGQGKLITTFSSEMHGMGSFDFVPKEGVSYQVEIIRPADVEQSLRLPQALPDGFVIRLEEINAEFAEVKIIGNKRQAITMVLRQHGDVVYEGKAEIGKDGIERKIPVGDLVQGVAQLTIFDSESRPFAERLIYVPGKKHLNIEVKTNQSSYGPGEEVKLSLTVSDEAGRPCAADLSLAAIAADLAEARAEKGSNLISWMTWESHLRGSVFQPQSYFDGKNQVIPQAVDYLLLTHGWRRYDWQYVLSENPVVPAIPAEQLALRGEVVNAYNQLPIEGAQVMLYEGEEIVQTDAKGHFRIPRRDAYRAVTLYISAPGFGTQQQRIIGVPGALKYELAVKPVVTPQTKERLSVKPDPFQGRVQPSAPDIASQLSKNYAPLHQAYFWPATQPAPVRQVEMKPPGPSFDEATSTLNMKEVGIYGTRVPVFPRDPNLQSVTQFDATEIQHIPVRSINDFAALSAGVYQADAEGSALNVRGGRSTSNQYIVDGVKVRGTGELPQGAMKKVQIYLSGAPAEYGDFTGGLIVMESKGPRMMWMMDTVAVIETPPRPVNMEEVLSQVNPPQGEVKGSSWVTVFVDEKGRYKRHKIQNSTHKGWTKSLKTVLPSLNFEPAITTAGTPYAYQVDLPFAFYADDELAKDHPTDTLTLPELRSSADFYAERSFYVPSPAQLKGKTDERTTLYWNGRLSVPASGRLTVRFRTSDVATRFAVVVEGIGDDGRLGSVLE